MHHNSSNGIIIAVIAAILVGGVIWSVAAYW
jgi:hypothetical protein